MINWFGVQIFLFGLASLVNFILVLNSTISLWVGLFMWVIGLPILFTFISFVLVKLEEKGYIHNNENRRIN